MKNNSIKAFTLVELVVVVTIITILWTIWFVSYNGYMTWARDTNRTTQLVTINDWLNVYRTKADLLLPENAVIVKANSSTIWFQWYIWQDNLDLITYTKWWKDPKDWSFFTYYVSQDRKNFQLMTYLEDNANSQVSYIKNNQSNFLISQSYSADLDYSIRFPSVYWKKLWVLVDSVTNTPIQEIDTIKTAWYLDIATTPDIYTAYISNTIKVTWTGSELVKTIYNSSCKRIKEIWWSQWNWIYTISPLWIWTTQVYCEMTTAWGGWTLVWRSVLWSTSVFWFTTSTWDVLNDSIPYSLWNMTIPFTELLFWDYSFWKEWGDNIYKKVVWNISLASSSSWASTTVLSPACASTLFTFAWYASNTNYFFLSNLSPLSAYWLNSSSFVAQPWCTGWNLNWLQWMIFIR